MLDSGFFHGLGHGAGLEVHERPWISRAGDDLLPGDVITLGPGLYRAGYGGVRLEDILLVTEEDVEVVTNYPYDLEPQPLAAYRSPLDERVRHRQRSRGRSTDRGGWKQWLQSLSTVRRRRSWRPFPRPTLRR